MGKHNVMKEIWSSFVILQDGGTLGEVIAALRKQKQYRIIQEISDLAEEFLDVYNTYHKTNLMSAENGTAPSSGHLYSILKTLFETFNKSGQEDPLNKFQLYSGGFKQYMRGLAPGPTTDTMGLPPGSDIIVNAVHFNQQGKNGTASVRSEDSGYTSPHRFAGHNNPRPQFLCWLAPSFSSFYLSFTSFRYAGSLPSMTENSLEQSSPISEITKIRKTHKVLVQDEDDLKPRHTIRILLVFAKDGAGSAEEIVTGMINFQIEDYPNIRVRKWKKGRQIATDSGGFLPPERAGAVAGSDPEPRGLPHEVAGRDGLRDATPDPGVPPGPP